MALMLAACSASASPSATPVPQPTPTPRVQPSGTAEATPTEEQTDPTPPPGSDALALVPCPLPRATAPACLDTTTDSGSPARTAALKVGQTATIVATIRNSGTTVSPPLTMLLFTYEQPFFGSFLKATACQSCQIHEGGVEWPGLAPGDHQLAVTLSAVGVPANGRDESGAYEWLFALYAEPYAQAAAGAIYVSASFASGTGATVINP